MISPPRTLWRSHCPRTSDHSGFVSWLRDRGSLTARLQSQGEFSLRLLRQELGIPVADEASALRIPCDKLAWIREVALSCDGIPVVFAHTVLPRLPQGAMSRWLARLGQRSLGALLFAHAGFKRGPLESARLDHRHPLFLPAIHALKIESCPPAALWARRSKFSYDRQSVLVTEVFSPSLRVRIRSD